jgi:hypothetical protein
MDILPPPLILLFQSMTTLAFCYENSLIGDMNESKQYHLHRIVQLILIPLLLSSGCNNAGHNPHTPAAINDTGQIKTLVIQAYKWHQHDTSKNDMVPLAGKKDTACTGIDLDKHKIRLNELGSTNFFSDEFIANYDKIVRTIDSKLKSKELVWPVGDLPPFGSDSDPWCNCQDYPDASPWDKIKFKFISLNDKRSSLSWTWGNADWSKGFDYRIELTKTNGSWKISSLQGFDFNKFTARNY